MRNAQGGMNAAVLVAVIAGLILLYILFLPTSEREELLENKSVKKPSSTTNGNDGEEDVLLRESPGRLDTIEGVSNKAIPNIFLFEKTNAKEIAIINPIIARNGWFDKKSRAVSFGIDDLENTDNIILSFNAKKHSGILTIKLNNEIIYENEIESETVAPIKLNKNLLRKDNSLEFSVSSVGFKFWRTNEYSLDDIKITGDITDKSKQESRNIFTLTENELFNIDKADLKFVPYCRNEADVGVLDVSINSKSIFSAVPVCEDSYKQPIPLGLLNAGENRVIFKTNKGSYSVEQIKVEFTEKEIRTKIYYFEANRSQINEIKNGNRDAVLSIEFTDDTNNKRADLNINDRLFSIDTEKKTFTKKLNDRNDPDLIEEGNNFIELRPRTMLDIVELKVALQDR